MYITQYYVLTQNRPILIFYRGYHYVLFELRISWKFALVFWNIRCIIKLLIVNVQHT